MSNKEQKPADLEQQIALVTAKWRANPRLYLSECLGIEAISGMQKEVLDAVPRAIAERKPIYIGSGHSLGKDFLGGCLGNWFLDCFIPSKIILTAPTDRQVKKIMWAETLDKFNKKNPRLWGTAYADPYIEVQKENWFLMGFTTKESGASAGSGGKFQGIRSAKNMLIIVSEAQAVEDNIRDQIDGILTAENVLALFLGNPTRSKGFFAAGLKDKVNNIVFNFSCLDSPNYKQRKIVIPGLTTYEWVEDKRKRWGETDPRWISRVLGQVPSTSINHLFHPDLMDRMRAKHGFLSRFSDNRGVAVDSAGEGMDDNVFMSGGGGEIIDVYTIGSIIPSKAAIKAVEMCKLCNGKFIIVDCDGIGIGVWQELENLPKGYLQGIEIIKFHGSSKAVEEVQSGNGMKSEIKRIYANKRAQAAFVAQDRAIRGCAAVNEKDRELVEELEADEWFENKRGEIQLIEKSDIKESLDPPRSPGRADCWKMLQWAFEQNFKDNTYREDGQQVASYANTDTDVLRTGQQSYARTE